MFFRVGRVSACGSRILANFVPNRTATVLTRLDSAGAIDIARLNMVEFATGGSVFGHNPITGTPRNPWNSKYVTGGSSSGSGAAVAARLVYGALASDTGGSLRIPACCCGLVGIKPTYGRVSRYGAMPLAFSLDHPGVVTRTVVDCARLLRIIAGHDPNDPWSSTRSVPDYSAALEGGVSGLRIGIPSSYYYDYVDEAIGELLETSIAVFRNAGADIVRVEIPPSFANASSLNSLIFHAEAGRLHSRWLRSRASDYGPRTGDRFVAGLHLPATRYIEALNLRAALLADFVGAVFGKVDVLHAPVVPISLPTIAASDPANLPDYADYSAQMSHCTRPLNFLGLPALSMPAGFDANGLPAGFQLIGRPFDEALLFLDTGAVVAAELHPADEGDTTTLSKTLAKAEANLGAVDAAPTAEDPAECVADKGYHSRAVLRALDDSPWKTRIAAPKQTGFSRWHGDEAARRAVTNNRARLKSGVAREAFKLRAEIVERCFAHLAARARTGLRA